MSTYFPPGHPSFHLDYPEHATVSDVLAGAAARYGDRVALRDGDQSLTFTQLYDAARRLAGGLHALGVQPGETVALDQPNSLWFTVSYYGVLVSGAVVTPVNPTLPAAVVREQLLDSGAVAVIAHPVTLKALAGADVPTVRHTIVVPPTAAAPGAVPESFAGVHLETLLAHDPAPPAAIRPTDLAHLSFTGGTTGRSKAVEITHRNVVANGIQTAAWRTGSLPIVDSSGGVSMRAVPQAQTRYTSEPGTGRTIALAPLFHAMGLGSQTVSVLTGTEVTIFSRFDPVQFLDTVESQRITQMQGSPALLHALLSMPDIGGRDLSSVKYIGSGAAPIESDVVRRVGKVFPNALVVEGYGLTEATMAVTHHPHVGPGVVPAGSVGAPLFDTEILIRSLDDGAELPLGEVGEVWVRGPQVSRGYRDHPELTEQQYPPGGWLRTGDLGHTDAQGWLFLVGRAKDMIIYKGYNVYPLALEELLTQHPDVSQASVIGVPRPGLGEIPVAYVVPARGVTASAELAQELIDHVAARVAPYARVREVVFIDGLPTSAAGKVLKTELRSRYVEGQAQLDS